MRLHLIAALCFERCNMPHPAVRLVPVLNSPQSAHRYTQVSTATPSFGMDAGLVRARSESRHRDMKDRRHPELLSNMRGSKITPCH